MRWFLLDTTHPAYNGARALCGARHARNWPQNILSIVLSDDGTQALVKSDSMGKAFRKGKWAEKKVLGGVLLDIFDRSDHSRVFAFLSTAAWSNTRTET